MTHTECIDRSRKFSGQNNFSTMSKLDAKTGANGDKNIIKSSSTTTKKITSSKTITKTVVSGSSLNKSKNIQQFKTSATQNIFSEKSWTSALHDGRFGSSLQEENTVQYETQTSESKQQEIKGSLHFDEQRAIHLKQGARPKTTSSSLIRSSAINSKLDSGFDLHADLHIPSSIPHPSATSLKMKEVWEEGFTLFPEYFPDVFSGQSLRERFQRSANTDIPVKETKLLSSSTKQYSWEKLDGDEESEAQKIANSWLQIFGESEPKKDNEQKAIKNS